MPNARSASKKTTNPDIIRRWVEARGGCPARVKGTGKNGDAGLMRIDYPGFSGQTSLEPISWREFFKGLAENDLVFVYQDKTASGRPSRFSKLVSRANASSRQSSANGRSAKRTSKRTTKKTSGSRAAARSTRSRTRSKTGSRSTRGRSKSRQRSNA